MVAVLDHVGNASSVHRFGRSSRQVLETARADCLASLGANSHRLAFTSGATEGLATCLRPGVQHLAAKTTITELIISPTEHVAALEGHGFSPDRVRTLPVDGAGRVDVATLKAMLENTPNPAKTMVCVQAANNETGVLQPVDDLAGLCREHGALMVSDCVQMAGRLPLPDILPDVMVISGHKVGGPTGIGAILFDPIRVHIPNPLLRGGGQERGVRAGTENVAGAVGLAAALKDACADLDQEAQRLAGLRDGFEAALKARMPEVVIFGERAPRLPNTSSFAVPGKEAALALMQLDLAGVALSSGSACSSGKVSESHVLKAMGVAPDLARCALRASFGFASTDHDAERLLEAVSSLKALA